MGHGGFMPLWQGLGNSAATADSSPANGAQRCQAKSPATEPSTGHPTPSSKRSQQHPAGAADRAAGGAVGCCRVGCADMSNVDGEPGEIASDGLQPTPVPATAFRPAAPGGMLLTRPRAKCRPTDVRPETVGRNPAKHLRANRRQRCRRSNLASSIGRAPSTPLPPQMPSAAFEPSAADAAARATWRRRRSRRPPSTLPLAGTQPEGRSAERCRRRCRCKCGLNAFAPNAFGQRRASWGASDRCRAALRGSSPTAPPSNRWAARPGSCRTKSHQQQRQQRARQQSSGRAPTAIRPRQLDDIRAEARPRQNFVRIRTGDLQLSSPAPTPFGHLGFEILSGPEPIYQGRPQLDKLTSIELGADARSADCVQPNAAEQRCEQRRGQHSGRRRCGERCPTAAPRMQSSSIRGAGMTPGSAADDASSSGRANWRRAAVGPTTAGRRSGERCPAGLSMWWSDRMPPTALSPTHIDSAAAPVAVGSCCRITLALPPRRRCAYIHTATDAG